MTEITILDDAAPHLAERGIFRLFVLAVRDPRTRREGWMYSLREHARGGWSGPADRGEVARNGAVEPDRSASVAAGLEALARAADELEASYLRSRPGAGKRRQERSEAP